MLLKVTICGLYNIRDGHAFLDPLQFIFKLRGTSKTIIIKSFSASSWGHTIMFLFVYKDTMTVNVNILSAAWKKE